ncbi:MAG: GAF domain-containing protein [Syntrophobacteraceae bacterium]
MKTVVGNHNGKLQMGEAKYLRKIETQQNLLSSIHKISGLLTRPVPLDRILTSIVEETSSAFGFSRVAIFLVDKERELLECKYLIGFRPHERERALTRPFRLDLHECLEILVVKSGKIIFVKDHKTDPRLAEIDLRVSRIQNRVSTLAVPLKIKKEVIGLIEADRGDVRLDITAADIRSFSVFANQASIVIENARLHEQNKRRIEQLLFLQHISRKIISSTLNLKDLLNVITRSALKITKASMAALFMLDRGKKDIECCGSKGVPGRLFKMSVRAW